MLSNEKNISNSIEQDRLERCLKHSFSSDDRQQTTTINTRFQTTISERAKGEMKFKKVRPIKC